MLEGLAFFSAVAGLFAMGVVAIEAYEAGLKAGRAQVEAEKTAQTWAALRHVTEQEDISPQQASGAWRVARALISSRIER